MTGKRQKLTAENASRSLPEMAFDPIKAALREIHESIAAEGIPDEFMDLLNRLDESSTKRKPS